MSRVVFESATRSFLKKASQSLNGDSSEIGSFIHDFGNTDIASVAEQLVGPDTELVVIGPELDLDTSLALSKHIIDGHPEVSVMLVTQPEPKVWEPALRAGVADVVAPSADAREIDRAFSAVLQRAEKRKKNLTRSLPPPSPGLAVPGAVVTEQRRAITVVSPKGGSGKTMTSTNLALGLAQQNPGQTVLVDLDLEFGDVTNALLLEPDHTIYDAVRQINKLDITTLKVFLTPHPSGLYVLCAPLQPEEGEAIKPSDALRVLELLKAEFPYVVVDTAGGLSEHTLSAIEASTDVVLMSALDVASVRALSKAVDALDKLGMKKQTRHFVLNRANARVGLTPGDVEDTVGLPIDVEIQSSRAVPVSMNQGTPVLEINPRSRIGKQLNSLVERFVSKPEQTQIWRRG